MNTEYATKLVWKLLSALVLAGALTACGGGGGGGSGEGSASGSVDVDGEGSVVTNPPTEPEPTDPGDEVTGPDPFEPVTISLSWQIPTTREDGSPLAMAEIGGYEIYYYLDGSAPGSDCCSVTINSGSQDSVDVTLNEPGTWYFAIAAVDADGVSSDLSDPVSLVIN